MRIDKWLWAARFFKTRRLAVEALQKGRILVNNTKPKPARMVAVDDVIFIQKEQEKFEIKVLKLIETRGPAGIAQTMYEESASSIENRMEARELRKLMVSPKPEKAPDKHERRDLRRVKQQYLD